MKLILSLLLLFTLHTATAQSWQWGTSGGSSFNTGTTNTETIIDMATDANGNIYALTEVSGGTPITIGNQTINTHGGQRDILVFSYNCNGQFRWAKCIGAPIGSDQAKAIAVDGQNNVYVMGRVPGNAVTAYFDTDTVIASTGKSSFVIQYDSSGNYQWLRQHDSDTVPYIRQIYYNKVNDIVGDPAGGLYILSYMPAGLLAGGDGIVVPAYGMYMLHYNAQGNITELTPMDMEINPYDPNQTSFTNIRMARMNSGKFIIAGTASAQPPSTNYNFNMGGQTVSHSMFIGCFNSLGNFLWKKEGTTYAFSTGFYYRPVIDNSSGNIILGGKGYPAVSFSGYSFNNSYGNHEMPFICMLDSLGNTIWITNASTNAATTGTGVALDNNNTVYSTGNYPGTIIWGNHSLQNVPNQGYDVFLAKFDAATGTVLGMDSLGGNFGNNDAASAIIADNKGNVYVGGNMSSQLYVNNQTLTSNGGSNDFFIAKYGSADCSSVVPVNITYFNATLQNKAVYLQWQTANEINVSHFNIQRSTNGTEFTTIGKTNAMGNGNNSYNYIDNEVASIIPPSGGGGAYYRLQNIDKDGSYTYSKIENIQLSTFNTQLSIYPNPTRNIVNVVSKNIQQINIIDFTGRILIQQNFNNANNVKLNIANLSKGIYLLKVVDIKGNVQTKKLIVE